MRTLRTAESIREYALNHQMFMYIDKGILRRKETETRALCITPEVIQGVENRCWIHVADHGGRSKRGVEIHLSHCGDIKQVMMDGLIIHVLEAIMDDEMSLVNKKKIWRRFLTFREIRGHGFSRYELRIYEAWWNADLKEHGGHTEQSDKPGRVLWNWIELVEENVVRLAENQIRKLPLAMIQRAIHILRVHFTVPKETAIRMAQEMLSHAEDMLSTSRAGGVYCRGKHLILTGRWKR
jgi:hypothetical protein